MKTDVLTAALKGHRFPSSIVSHTVWLYHRFALSLRDVEDLLAERGIIVSYETIRIWCRRFGPQIAAKIRRDWPAAANKWHLDEVVITIRERSTGCGGRSTPTATRLKFSCKIEEMPRLPSVFCTS